MKFSALALSAFLVPLALGISSYASDQSTSSPLDANTLVLGSMLIQNGIAIKAKLTELGMPEARLTDGVVTDTKSGTTETIHFDLGLKQCGIPQVGCRAGTLTITQTSQESGNAKPLVKQNYISIQPK